MSNYLELYKNNLDLDKSKNSELLRKYEEYIRNPKKVTCPFDKKDNVIILNNNDEIIIKCKSNDNWILKITKSISINLYEKLDEIKKLRSIILNNISNQLENDKLNLNTFNNLKTQYKNINDEYENIIKVFEFQNEEKEIIKNEIIELKFNIGNLFYEKVNVFESIKKYFNNELNKQIKKIYFNDKKLEEKQIKDFSIKHKIPIDDFKKILNWYELNKKYIELSNTLRIKELNFEDYNNKIDNINFNFITKFSIIKENELIKNKKKKYNSIKLKK
jgi:hypothetical protein